MNWDWYKTAIWLAWLALPTTALNYWRAWDRLPMRMAVHFKANWQPNGWTTREGSLLFALGVITFMLVLCTAASYIVRALKPRSSWPVLIAFYVGLGFCWYGSNSIVEYNLHGGRQTPQSACVRGQLARG
ncbi:MAG: DUF1648 domain-containing protein [Candidatus Sulfotelmatobacter sp.]|jgi:hypothetical protein